MLFRSTRPSLLAATPSRVRTGLRSISARQITFAVVVLGGLLWGWVAGSARAQTTPDGGPVAPCNAPVPANAEGPPIQQANGGYCYDGAHPVDKSAAAGPAWDNAPGRHTHFYPPLDPRLFVLTKDCYRFVGDPQDFGFDGQTQAYYGTHPVPGGGWCFMTGGHHHAFHPWSPQFVMVGPWLHWQGDYDASFWSAWPYYSAFHKDLYPRFYGGGRWQREHKVAPRLPPGAWTHKTAPGATNSSPKPRR